MIENNIDSAERRCPACDSARTTYVGQKNDFRMLSCQKCGTLYTSGLPAPESAEDYDGYYNSENLSVPDFINKRLDEIVAGFSAYRQNGRLLDIGFGAGTVLQAAARAGWTATGIEVSQTAVEYVRGLGFTVFCGELAEAKYPDGHFDVITASEVLEHVPEPDALLREMARVLRPGGLLWATTPNGKGLSSRLLGLKWSTVSPPEHLQLFSLKGLKTMLDAAGFRRVRIVTHGVNPFEILHTLRQRRSNGEVQECSDRVGSSYRLNEFLTESHSRKALKGIANGLLSVGHFGDSLKTWAEK